MHLKIWRKMCRTLLGKLPDSLCLGQLVIYHGCQSFGFYDVLGSWVQVDMSAFVTLSFRSAQLHYVCLQIQICASPHVFSLKFTTTMKSRKKISMSHWKDVNRKLVENPGWLPDAIFIFLQTNKIIHLYRHRSKRLLESNKGVFRKGLLEPQSEK